MTKPKAVQRILWEKALLTAIQQTGNLTLASQVAGIDRRTVYKRYRIDDKFREEYDNAMDAGIDILEAEARRRAMAGSDTLLIFLLKGARPEKYRDNYHVETSSRPTTYVIDLGLPDDPTPLADATPAQVLE